MFPGRDFHDNRPSPAASQANLVCAASRILSARNRSSPRRRQEWEPAYLRQRVLLVYSLWPPESNHPTDGRIAAMDIRSHGWVRTTTSFAGRIALLVLGFAASASSQQTAGLAQPARMPPNSPDEPIRPKASLAQAAAFLDSVAIDWTRQRKCGTCHTNYPYMMARPILRETDSPAMTEIRAFFEDRVAHWDDADQHAKPRWDAEVVSTAEALAIYDQATGGKLHPRTRAVARPHLEGSETRWRLRLAQVRMATL